MDIIINNNKIKEKEVFFKLAPLLDPYKYLVGKYDINDKWCMINYKLIDEINSFFSTDDSTSRILITQWFENTLQIEVSGSVAGLSQYGFQV